MALDRLLSKVRMDGDSGCWNWTASKFGVGYGQFKLNGKMRLAHRVSWELHNGAIPDGMHVCHTCDNRACINPEHLFLGNNADNVADKVAKGRQVRHKLTESDVLAIRAAEGVSQARLASKFGVARSLISNIRNRTIWKMLPA
jgi:DNA-binding XRE family transcriptional regulator